MPGMKTVETYTPTNILANMEGAVPITITVQKGLDLSAGQLVGEITSGNNKWSDYAGVAPSAAAASTPAAGADNVGETTCSAITVSDTYTPYGSWTATCTTTGGDGVAEWKLEEATFGVCLEDQLQAAEMSYPAGATAMVKLTLSDGGTNSAVGDTFTFTTTGQKTAVAQAVLGEAVDATDEDVASFAYIHGNFVESALTGIDADARAHLYAKSVGNIFTF